MAFCEFSPCAEVKTLDQHLSLFLGTRINLQANFMLILRRPKTTEEKSLASAHEPPVYIFYGDCCFFFERIVLVVFDHVESRVEVAFEKGLTEFLE